MNSGAAPDSGAARPAGAWTASATSGAEPRPSGGSTPAVAFAPGDLAGQRAGASAALAGSISETAIGGGREGKDLVPAETGVVEAASGRATSDAGKGSSDGPGEPTAEYYPYLQRLRRQIQETIKYPSAARRRGLAGTVRVEIVLRPSGEIETVAVVGSSTHSVLDNAVLDAIRALRPLPFPPDLPRRRLRVELPIVFDFR